MLKESLIQLINKTIYPEQISKAHTIHLNERRIGFFKRTSYSQQTLTIYDVVTDAHFPFKETFELHFNTEEGTYILNNVNFSMPLTIGISPEGQMWFELLSSITYLNDIVYLAKEE